MTIHSLTIETSTRCNAKCKICPNHYVKREDRLMPVDHFEAILYKVSPAELNFCGVYEPLTDIRLPTFIAVTKSVLPTCRIVVYSNGSLVDRYTDLLLESVDEIIFSIHGFGKEVYENIMQGLNRDKVYQNVQDFIKARNEHSVFMKPKIRVSFVRTRQNVHELGKWRAFWTGKADEVCDFEIMSWQGTVPVEQFYDRIPKRERMCPMFDPYPSTVVVDASGMVMLCCYCFKREMSFGHVLEDGLQNWLDKKPVSDTYPRLECKQCNGWKYA